MVISCTLSPHNIQNICDYFYCFSSVGLRSYLFSIRHIRSLFYFIALSQLNSRATDQENVSYIIHKIIYVLTDLGRIPSRIPVGCGLGSDSKKNNNNNIFNWPSSRFQKHLYSSGGWNLIVIFNCAKPWLTLLFLYILLPRKLLFRDDGPFFLT